MYFWIRNKIRPYYSISTSDAKLARYFIKTYNISIRARPLIDIRC